MSYPISQIYSHKQLHSNNKKDQRAVANNKFLKYTAISTGIGIGAITADLFLTKGKLFSTLSRGKIKFISKMEEDIQAVIIKDPASKGKLETILCCPGVQAIWMHRIAHKLYKWKIPVLPRFIQNISRMVTGIEIHPGAKFGHKVFIDHTGAIIGETAEVGNNVEIIGRVVLGGTGKEKGLRHPVVEDNVVICMNSTLLGRIKIGKDSIIGAGTLVLKDVPNGATVIGHPGKVVKIYGKKVEAV